MTPNFVTNSTFNKAMKNIDGRFEAVDARFETVDKRFDAVDKKFEVVHRDIEDLRKMIRETMEEQRVIFNNDMTRYIGAVIEESRSQFKALYEHPVFANHKS